MTHAIIVGDFGNAIVPNGGRFDCVSVLTGSAVSSQQSAAPAREQPAAAAASQPAEREYDTYRSQRCTSWLVPLLRVACGFCCGFAPL